MKKLKVCMLLFPELTIQDFIGPYEVFSKAGCFEIFVVSEKSGLVVAEGGLEINATYCFEDVPSCDILFVPGGRGVTPLINHQPFLSFLHQQAASSKYITSVCTGSLLLAAAGLLKGYRATTHWRSYELLQLLDVDVVNDRVVVDRNRITGGGITSGIDFGLTVIALVAGDDLAKRVQLILEYNPEPPFTSGSPRTAEQHILQQVTEATQGVFDLRKKVIHERISQTQL